MAAAMHVALVAGRAEHCPGADDVELRRDGHEALVASDGIPHHDLTLLIVDEEDASVATLEQPPVLVVVDSQGEALGSERDHPVVRREEAEDGRPPVVDAEAAEEFGVGGEASPALADEGGAQEVGRLRGRRRWITWRRSSSSMGSSGTTPATRIRGDRR